MNKVGRLARVTGEDVIQLVTRLAERYDDETIAAILGKQRRRTATGLPWTRARVAALRGQHHIPACPRPAANVTPAGQDAVVVTITRAEQMLGVSRVTLYRWLRDGFITGEQMTPGAPWQIRIDQALRDKIRPEAPDGWLPLDQAAKALGIARQTVLHKVQRGELQAVHVNRGRRKGLRIQVKHDQTGLFDTSDKEKGAVLTMTGAAGEDQVLPCRPRHGSAGLARACSARRTAIRPASCSPTASRPGRPASPSMLGLWALSGLGAPFTAVMFRLAFPASPGSGSLYSSMTADRKRRRASSTGQGYCRDRQTILQAARQHALCPRSEA